MAFMSLLFLWIFLFLAVIGLVLLLISILLYLANWRRKKKGKEKKRLYKIAGILCLVFGCLNLAPILVLVVWATVGENITNVIDHMKVAFMPERAILYEIPSDEEEQLDDVENYKESEDETEDDEDNVALLYKNKEYLPVFYDPVGEKLEVSKPKAYLQYDDGEDGDIYIGDELVLEVTSNTGFDLLCTGRKDSGLLLSRVYCRKDQCEDFQRSCQSEAVYYLERTEDEDFRVSGDDFTLDNLGITVELLDSLDDGKGEVLGSNPKDEYDLSVLYIDGLFSNKCARIGKYKGRWYCYENTYGEIQNAHLLPDEGQRFMNAL